MGKTRCLFKLKFRDDEDEHNEIKWILNEKQITGYLRDAFNFDCVKNSAPTFANTGAC